MTQVQYLENAWYVAALTDEVTAAGLFRRVLLERSVMIYRKLDGTPVAMDDRCPHRFLPLSAGTRIGDEIQCHYHGLRFNSEGLCVHNPHGDGKIPSAAQVRDYPVVERDGFIWIWMGDKQKADDDLIMDCSLLTKNPSTSVLYNYMHNDANYELLTDNIMDLSHIDYIHGPLINTSGQLSPLKPNVKEINNDIHVQWDWIANPVMQLFAPNLEDPEKPVKQFFSVKWHAPSNMHLQVGALEKGEDYHQDGLVFYDFHIMTPETKNSTHYFHGSTRNYMQNDKIFNEMHKSGIRHAFVTEDKPVLDLQQDEMKTHDLFALNPVLLTSDAGNIRVRRKLQSLIEAEKRM